LILKKNAEVFNELPGRVEIPVTTGTRLARTEALLTFDVIRTTKRTPLAMDVGVDVQVEEMPSSGTIYDLSRVGQNLLAEEFLCSWFQGCYSSHLVCSVALGDLESCRGGKII
jgi:hypothetical protein